MKLSLLGAAAMAVLLAGCGTNPTDRTTGGAATGAATGAVIGAVGGPVGVGAGAAIGAGVGAATGAVTTPNQVNLGTPPWDNPDTTVAGRHVSRGSARSTRHVTASRSRYHRNAAATSRARRGSSTTGTSTDTNPSGTNPGNTTGMNPDATTTAPSGSAR